MAHSIEGRSLFMAFRTANAAIFVDLDDFAAHAASNRAQLALLIGRGLLGGRGTQIKNSTLQGRPRFGAGKDILIDCLDFNDPAEAKIRRLRLSGARCTSD